MFRSLYSRLAAVLLGLVVVLGVAQVALAIWLTRYYRHEVEQKLNASLAEHLAAELPLMQGGAVNEEALEQAFHMMMVINPAIEVYLLDPGGRILAYSAPPERVVRETVDLQPVHAFLEQARSLPILGDDPRDLRRRKAFSAASLETAGERQGYLYVVLGGESYDSAADAFRASHILRLGTAAGAAALLFGLAGGLVLMRLVTRRLRHLALAMDRFRRNEFRQPVSLATPGVPRDEIDRLAVTFGKMSERIQEQVAELERTDTQRRELVASVSHDLRTPLAALRGYLETLLLKAATLSSDQRDRYLAIALRHAERLGRLIDDLFELAKLDAQQSPPACEPFPIGELVQDVVQKFQITAEEKGVRLQAAVDRDLPPVFAEIGLVERVLANLIDNGVRHTPPGGTVQVGLASAPTGVDVQVRDTGCGIPPDELPRVFDRFYRGNREAGGVEGTGLGLAIAQRIVALHGGRIQAESLPGQGSTFRFRLPLPPS